MNPRRRSHRPTKSEIDAKAAKAQTSRAVAPAASRTTGETKLGIVEAPGGYRILGMRKWQIGFVILLALLSFLLYLITASRTVPTGDSGELIAAAWNLGVAHPPGYPTFTILSHLAGLLPFGTIAFRMNLLSAILDSLTIGVLAFGVLRLLRAGSSGKNTGQLIPVAATVAGIGLLAVSTAFWGYSTMAEVFALNNFLAALTLVLMLEWVRRPGETKFLWFASLCAGLALTNQLTMVLLAPGLFTLLIWGLIRWRRENRPVSIEGRSGKMNAAARPTVPEGDHGWPYRDLGIAAGLFVLGLLPYIYLPLAAQSDPPINFGDPSSLSNFWRVITRANYGTFSFTTNNIPGDRFQQLYFIWRHFVQSFTVPGVLLAILGVVWFARRRPIEGIGLGLAFLFSGPLFAMFANPQLENPLTQGVFERFYILPSLPFAIFAAAGVVLVFETAKRLAAKVRFELMQRLVTAILCAAILAMLGSLAFARLPSLDMSDNSVAEDYGEDLLAPLEPGALLIMTNDYNYGSVVYTQLVRGFRTDVVALHAELLKASWYVTQQRRQHPEVTIPFSFYDEGKRSSLAGLISSNIGRRPVYGVGTFKEDLTESYDEVYWGMAVQYFKKGEGTDKYALLRTKIDYFSKLDYPDKIYPATSWESAIAAQYGELAFYLAFDRQQPEAQADADFVEQMYRTAILNAPKETGSYKNLGLLLWKNGGSSAEIIDLLEKYLQLVPDDPEAGDMRLLVKTLKAQP